MSYCPGEGGAVAPRAGGGGGGGCGHIEVAEFVYQTGILLRCIEFSALAAGSLGFRSITMHGRPKELATMSRCTLGTSWEFTSSLVCLEGGPTRKPGIPCQLLGLSTVLAEQLASLGTASF